MKLTKALLIVPIIIFFARCTETKNIEDGKLRFGVDQCYLLEDTEQLVSLSDSLKEIYLPFSECGAIQYPVNRVVLGENKATIISIATINNLKNSIECVTSDLQTANVLEKRIGGNEAHFLIKNNDTLFDYEYIFGTKELIYAIHVISNDKKIIQSNYENESYFKEKLGCKFD